MSCSRSSPGAVGRHCVDEFAVFAQVECMHGGRKPSGAHDWAMPRESSTASRSSRDRWGRSAPGGGALTVQRRRPYRRPGRWCSGRSSSSARSTGTPRRCGTPGCPPAVGQIRPAPWGQVRLICSPDPGWPTSDVRAADCGPHVPGTVDPPGSACDRSGAGPVHRPVAGRRGGGHASLSGPAGLAEPLLIHNGVD